MKTVLTYRNTTKLIGYLLAVTIVLSACNKETPNNINYQYLSEYSKVTSYGKTYISIIFSQAGQQEPTILELKDSAKYAVDVYKVSYKSMFKGEVKNASGLVCIPAANDAFPVISFQNGTNTTHNHAPSENYDGSIFKVLAALASNGYIIVIPDYFGFGSSNDVLHPYYEKETSNSAIIDLLKATVELLNTYNDEATYNNNLYLMGYSQGAWATLAALQEIESNPLPELDVKGTSCGAGAYNLFEVSKYLIEQDTFPSPLYLPYFVYSHQQYGSLSGSLDYYFSEPYASRIPQLFNGDYTREEINEQLTKNVSELLTTDLATGFTHANEYAPIRNELINNSLYAAEISSPLHIYHGNADAHVPYTESVHLVHDFEALEISDAVDFITLENHDHLSGVIPWGVETITWFGSLENQY